MKWNGLGKLGFSETPSQYPRRHDSETYRHYCTAKWLLETRANDEIKDKWLKMWPHLHPYLRLILVCKQAKIKHPQIGQGDFLNYWKQAIQLTGFNVVPVSRAQVNTATDKYELPLKGWQELDPLINKKDEMNQQLLALMISLFNPAWGERIGQQHQIQIARPYYLNEHYYQTYCGLLCTYKGF